MILIDSLYINNSGGFRLLKYLVSVLHHKGIDFYLLADARCTGKFDGCKHVRYMTASLWERKKFYKAKSGRFSSVLCFGNIPTPVKMDVPVYTYFHNINLLTLDEAHSIPVKVKSWLKREVFRYYKKNTDFWLVQTSNTASELVSHLGESSDRVKLMPFYELPEGVEEIAKQPHGDDYVHISTYVPEKGHENLIEAWKILHKRGINKRLHLTVPLDCYPIADVIKKLQGEGVNIVNHGLVPFKQVIELYGMSKAIVYPSHNESLGLGIVEALVSGCDVIGANLPYIQSICHPSVVFDPYNPKSIANAVERYENGIIQKSVLTIYNHIDELIELLSDNI